MDRTAKVPLQATVAKYQELLLALQQDPLATEQDAPGTDVLPLGDEESEEGQVICSFAAPGGGPTKREIGRKRPRGAEWMKLIPTMQVDRAPIVTAEPLGVLQDGHVGAGSASSGPPVLQDQSAAPGTASGHQERVVRRRRDGRGKATGHHCRLAPTTHFN